MPALRPLKNVKTIKVKNKILILLAAITLTSCLDQDTDGCPADMYLTFSVDDPYEPDTYDSRLGSDVMLYVFKDKRVVSGTLIPYEKISGGKEYVIRKDPDHSGNIDLLAWAVPADKEQALIPKLSPGDNLDDIYRELNPVTRAQTECHPSECFLHMARITTTEIIDQPTKHNLGLNYSDCRMEVKVTDYNNILAQPGRNPEIYIYGTMSKMNMDKKGVGTPALLRKQLNCPANDNVIYHTGRFGVLPPEEGKSVSVNISDGNNTLQTLTVSDSALLDRVVSGGLIILEYTLGAPEFTIIAGGFRQNIVIIDDM